MLGSEVSSWLCLPEAALSRGPSPLEPVPRRLSASGYPAPGERSAPNSALQASARLCGRAPTPRRSPGPPPAGWAAQRGLGAARTPAPEQRNAGGAGEARGPPRGASSLCPRGASWVEVPACHCQARAQSPGQERGAQGQNDGRWRCKAPSPPPPPPLQAWVSQLSTQSGSGSVAGGGGGGTPTAASWKTTELGIIICSRGQYLECLRPLK